MSFEPRDYLRHIQIEAEYLARQSAGVSAEEFLQDETLRRATCEAWRSSVRRQRESLKIFAHGIRRSNGEPWLECVIGSFTDISAWIMSWCGTWRSIEFRRWAARSSPFS
jgi:hypothetical protein